MGLGRDAFPLPEEMTAAFACAVMLRRERAFERARELLEELLARAPGNPHLLAELAHVHYRQGEFGAAEDLYRLALAVDSRHEGASAGLCMLCARVGRHDEAAEHASAILAAQPEAALTWYTLGIVFAWRREWERSLDYSLIAVGMDDKFADAHYNCACAYAQLGNPCDALGHLCRGLADMSLLRLATLDPDLDPLRALPAFGAIIARARERLELEGAE